MRRAVTSDNRAAVLHPLRKQAGFATGCRASVKHSLPRLRIEQLASDHRTRILNVTKSAVERLGWNTIQFNKIRIAGERASRRVSLEKFFALNFKTVHAGIHGSRTIVPLAQSSGSIGAEIVHPSLDQELWM